MGQRIQISNLPGSVDDLLLRKLFELHGAVLSAVISRDCETGCSTGVGFIEMESDKAAAAAVAALHQRENHGCILSVARIESTENDAEAPHMFGPMNMSSGEAPAKESGRP